MVLRKTAKLSLKISFFISLMTKKVDSCRGDDPPGKWKAWEERPEQGEFPIYRHKKDYLGKPEKTKIEMIMNDMIAESKLKVRQLTVVRQMHEKFVAFNVGLIIGKIRERYRQMLETYRMSQDFRFLRMYHTPTGYLTRMYDHYARFHEHIHVHELAIDKLVDVVTSIPLSHLDVKNIEGLTKPKPADKPYARRLIEYDEDELKMMEDEAKVKNKMREAYLMKKIGMPESMTTPKKRFIQQWPVDETWNEAFENMQ